MEINLKSLSSRKRRDIINLMIEKSQQLVILEIGEDDLWYDWRNQLIGKTGKFVSNQNHYSLFKLDKPVEVIIRESYTGPFSKADKDLFHFEDAILAVVHSIHDICSIDEEISIIMKTDHPDASELLVNSSSPSLQDIIDGSNYIHDLGNPPIEGQKRTWRGKGRHLGIDINMKYSQGCWRGFVTEFEGHEYYVNDTIYFYEKNPFRIREHTIIANDIIDWDGSCVPDLVSKIFPSIELLKKEVDLRK